MTRVPKRITVRMLEQMLSCPDGIAAFRAQFGESVAFVPGNVYAAFDGPCRPFLFFIAGQLKPVGWSDAVLTCVANKGRCICDQAAVAILCRLARQNLPKKARST